MSKCQGTAKCLSAVKYRLVPVGRPDLVTYVCGGHASALCEALLSLPGTTHVRVSRGVSW